MKKLAVFGIAVVALGFGLVIASPKEEGVSAPPPTSSSVEQTIESKSQEDKIEDVLHILQKGCSKIGTVHYDKSQEAYIITPTDSVFIEDLRQVLDSGNETSLPLLGFTVIQVMR